MVEEIKKAWQVHGDPSGALTSYQRMSRRTIAKILSMATSILLNIGSKRN